MKPLDSQNINSAFKQLGEPPISVHEHHQHLCCRKNSKASDGPEKPLCSHHYVQESKTRQLKDNPGEKVQSCWAPRSSQNNPQGPLQDKSQQRKSSLIG